MRSIRNQLVTYLVGSTMLLSCAAGVGLYKYMEEVLEKGLDSALASRAQAITGAVRMDDDGQPHLQMDEAANVLVPRHEGPFYFQIWRADGRTLARDAPPTVGLTALPRLPDPGKRFVNAKLSDGTTLRAMQVSFSAHADEDEFESPARTAHKTTETLTVVVAHDRHSIDQPLAVLLSGLLLAAVIVTTGIMVIVSWGVRRGLRPLAKVSTLADRIGPDTLSIRFPGADQLPTELLPISLKLNELLDRLATGFARERRFSAAVAHELRTPLAELRSACDVALRWPEDSNSLTAALSEARDVTVQMSAMVQQLLSLTRQQAGNQPRPKLVRVDLTLVVGDAVAPAIALAAERRLVIDREMDPGAVVSADAEYLAPAIRNILDNAIAYTPEGGRICIRTVHGNGGRWSLQFSNLCQGLTPADLSCLFEPFWRADTARTTGAGHVGLGLTLVRAYCDSMGVTVDAALTSPDTLTITVGPFPNFC